MTLIIYSKCADATLIMSDKKQNDAISNHSQVIRKYFLPNHQEYVIALAGDGTRVDTITTPLDIEQTSADDVKEKIKSIVEIPKQPNLGTSDGFLLLLNKKPFEFYHVWTTIDKLGINHDNPNFECYGDGAILGKYLLHQFDLTTMNWTIAIQYLTSIMQEVAEHNDSVGNVEKYGFDFLIIFKDGTAKSGIIDKNFKIQKINKEFTPDESFSLDTVTKTPTTKKSQISKEQIKEIPPENITQDTVNESTELKEKITGFSKINSLIIQTDRSVYSYNDNIIVSIIHPKPKETSPIFLKVINKNQKTIFKQSIPLDSSSNGIYQLVIPVKGKEWDVRGEEFKIVAEHGDKRGKLSIWRSDFGATVELNQKLYTWTDKVMITVVAPDYSLNKDKPSSIGRQSDEKITISTSKGEIHNYELVETGKNTGIFTGEVCLTGFKGHHGKEFDKVKGITEGTNSGPDDGKLACSGDDYISVSFSTRYDTVTGSALIRWTIGNIQWLEPNYSKTSVGCVRVIDPDMNLDPNVKDEFQIRVWSDTDAKGLWVTVSETDVSSGIFEGRVRFSSQKTKDSLLVKDGDTVTAEYNDKTLPSPYTSTDELDVTATTLIGSSPMPLERVSLKSYNILNDENKTIQTLEVKQNSNIATMLINNQQKSQQFVLIAEIHDESGTIVQTPSVTGSLANNEEVFVKLPWVPQYAGNYVINLFVWENVNNPSSLSKVVTLKIKVNEIKHKVSIPIGTHIPGCEEENRCFLPSELIIKENESVMWLNDDTAAHTITSGTPNNGPDGNFDSSLFMSGNSFTTFFKTKGRYPYFCMVHPWQTGVVEVK